LHVSRLDPYRNGEAHWLTTEEEKQNAFLNKKFEVNDSWQEVIEMYLENLTETTISHVLLNCLRIDIGKHDRPSQMRVAEVLKRLGWVKAEKKRFNGKILQIWKSDEGSNGGSNTL